MCFNSESGWGFCYAKKGAGSFKCCQSSWVPAPLPCVGTAALHTELPGNPRLSQCDSTERSLNAEIQGELCFPRTASPFQLLSDWQLLVRGNDQHEVFETMFSNEENEEKMRVVRLKAHVFGSSEKSQCKLAEGRYKLRETEFMLTTLAARASSCHPDNGR